MAKLFALTSIFSLLLLATTFATSARILDEVTPQFSLPADAPDLIPPPDTVAPPATALPSDQIPATSAEVPPAQEPAIAPAADIPNTAAAAATPPSGVATAPLGTFFFFMHDILGGSHPSGRAVARVVANSYANNLPFSKPSNPIFPTNGGVPLNTINGVINNNNYPFLVGLNGAPSNSLIQSNGNNAVSGGGNNQAFVTAGQLPQGLWPCCRDTQN